jgi:hypothetical protein
MRKPLTVLLLGSGAAALVLSLGAATAMANSVKATWSVKPGGSISASGSVQVKDTSTGYIATCTSLRFTGTLKTGSGLSGAAIGSISSVVHGGCSVSGISFTVTATGLPYRLNATSFSTTTGVTKGSITGVILRVSMPACNTTLEGATSGSPGKIATSYSNAKGVLQLLSGGTMHAWMVNGCLGLVNNGDPLAFSATLTVTPKQIITSP